MQTLWVVALTRCIHLLVVPLETCLSFHPFCQLVSVGEVPVTKVQRHSHKGPLLKSGQPYILYLYLLIINHQDPPVSSQAAKTLLKTDSGQFGEDSDKL